MLVCHGESLGKVPVLRLGTVWLSNPPESASGTAHIMRAVSEPLKRMCSMRAPAGSVSFREALLGQLGLTREPISSSRELNSDALEAEYSLRIGSCSSYTRSASARQYADKMDEYW